MRSSRTSASPFLSSISLVLLATGCPSEQECGTGGAPATGIVASGADFTMTFGNITASENNDCPIAGTPEGVISLTLQGVQTDGTGIFTMCFQRPDRLNGANALGPDIPGEDVPARLVDVSGEASDCTFELADPIASPPTGTATGSGACANGTDPAGFALVLDGNVTFTRTCGANVDTVTGTVRGRVAITPQ
jgi:hypothetical protein